MRRAPRLRSGSTGTARAARQTAELCLHIIFDNWLKLSAVSGARGQLGEMRATCWGLALFYF
jgi:hypothetical protein